MSFIVAVAVLVGASVWLAGQDHLSLDCEAYRRTLVNTIVSERELEAHGCEVKSDFGSD